jgi:hypothetical protein
LQRRKRGGEEIATGGCVSFSSPRTTQRKKDRIMDIESLWHDDGLAASSRSDFDEIAKDLVEKLGETIHRKLSIDGDLENSHPHGFRAWVRTIEPLADSLGLSIKGMVFGTRAEQHPGMVVGATLFAYANGKRLETRDGECFIDLRLTPFPNGHIWQLIGWQRDEYGEYDEFE